MKMRTGTFRRWFLAASLFCCTALGAQPREEIRYQRGSVIQMMIEHPMYMFNDEIAAVFRKLPLSERFNDHNLGVKVVKFATQEYSDQERSIASFIRQVSLGNRAVAKWFDWDRTTGRFDMELIKERGLYNADLLDREMAAASIRGSAILSDAGENLIRNTYLVMSDICYKGKYSNKEEHMNSTGRESSFDVKIVSYIFQLNWSDDELYEFYVTCYENGVKDFVGMAKQYGFTFKAKVETDYGECSRSISQSKLMERVVARCLDINMAKLQTAYPDFRIKSPVVSVEPVRAGIGLKEGITPNGLFEVLEMSVDEKGVATYERVGTVKPVAGKIWDNRYMADEDDSAESKLGATEFERVSGGGFFPGMLIREIKK